MSSTQTKSEDSKIKKPPTADDPNETPSLKEAPGSQRDASAMTELLPQVRIYPRTYRGVVVWDKAEVEQLPEFQVRDNDIWLCSFPRSGTTLCQEMVYLVQTLDFEKARTVNLDDRFPVADVKNDAVPYHRGLAYLDNLPTTSPRFIKTHFHYFLLPDQLKESKGKIIYVVRNPKACALSLYKVLKYLYLPPTDTCSMEEWLEYFLNEEKVLHGPWWLHVQEFWEHRNDGNMLLLQFEDIVKEKRTAIRQIADFLGRDLSEEDVERIFEHTSLLNMKSNDAVNFKYMEEIVRTDKSEGGFINKGEVTGWRRELSADIIHRFDTKLKEKLGHTTLKFD